MKIALSNRQDLRRVDRRRVIPLLSFLAARAARKTPDILDTDVTVVVMDDKAITTVNEACFGLSTPTDVIVCRYDPLPGTTDCPSADIFVSIDRAVAEGTTRARRGYGWSVDKELALYLAHGCDHLTGADDRTAEERRRMRSRELRWLQQAERAGLLAEEIVSPG